MIEINLTTNLLNGQLEFKLGDWRAAMPHDAGRLWSDSEVWRRFPVYLVHQSGWKTSQIFMSKDGETGMVKAKEWASQFLEIVTGAPCD